MGKAKISEALLKRCRDYAVEEPSYTVAFAAWEMGISSSAWNIANAELLRLGIVREIEPRVGPYAAVYAYVPPPETKGNVRRLFPELDESRQTHGAAPVPLTGQPKGPSGRPGRDRKVQERGHRVKRQRQGT